MTGKVDISVTAYCKSERGITVLFNSIDFLAFFPIVVAIYFLIPKNARQLWLLVASYYFYMSWNPRYALLIAASTVITYGGGLFLDKAVREQKSFASKLCLAGCLVANLGILGVFKYANFFLTNLNRLFLAAGIGVIDRRLDLLLPVGISFYTFQALGYIIDVYRGDIKAEKSLLRYALFVSFFPQLVAGPIERSKTLLRQMQEITSIDVWNFERVRDGFFLMVWGLFQKMVIADRASLLVDKVINHYGKYGFFELSVAMVLFAFQIYCDFGGYTNIARGAAKIMGFSLTDNFRQPYLARSIKDFWRRWHISLTSWFTDYLYIPLGGNRKGRLRKYLNILLVFGISGLWHGASWNFVVWGLLHAIYLIGAEGKEALFQKVGFSMQDSFSKRIRETVLTFVLVDFAWIFFVSKSFTHACGIVRQMGAVFKTSKGLDFGLDMTNWIVLAFGLVVLFLVDSMREQEKSIFVTVGRQEIWFRWALYLGVIWGTIMLGIYGVEYDTSAFIYFQF